MRLQKQCKILKRCWMKYKIKGWVDAFLPKSHIHLDLKVICPSVIKLKRSFVISSQSVQQNRMHIMISCILVCAITALIHFSNHMKYCL